MKFLLDTHVVLWLVSTKPDALSKPVRALLLDAANEVYFSVVNIWEVAIKHALGRSDFVVDPHILRRTLLDDGYLELPITGAHAAAVATLPAHHRDPFDRMLIAQATIEGITLLTQDAAIAAYTQSPIRRMT